MHKNNNKKTEPKHFTVIELAVALFVIVFGFNGILTLFTTGVEAKTKAFDKNSASDGVVQFIQLASNEIKGDWTWTQALPNQKPTLDDSYVGWSDVPVFENGYMFVDFSSSVIDAAFDPTDPDHQDGLFRLRQSNGSERSNSILRAWKEVDDDFTDTSGHMVLHVEISWPAEVPYANRQKDVFSLDIYKAPVVAISPPEQNDGIVTKETETGIIVQNTGVVEGSRILYYTVTGGADMEGEMTELFISCPITEVSEFSNSRGWDMATGYLAPDNDEGLIISNASLNAGESFTFTYKLDLNYVPATIVAVDTELPDTSVVQATLAFSEDDFDYVYDYGKSVPNKVAFQTPKSSTTDESSVLHQINIELVIPPGTTLDQAITVQISAGGGSAASGTDYDVSGASATATFPIGAAPGALATVGITINDDTDVEGDETANLQLAVISGDAAVHSARSLHIATIVDDDSGYFSLSKPAGNASAAPSSAGYSSLTSRSASVIAAALNRDCTDVVSGTVHEQDGCLIRFNVSSVDLKNTRNWPVRKVAFWYLGGDGGGPDAINVNIGNNGTFTTLKGASGKKIQRLAFSRYANGNDRWISLDSDTNFCVQ